MRGREQKKVIDLLNPSLCVLAVRSRLASVRPREIYVAAHVAVYLAVRPRVTPVRP